MKNQQKRRIAQKLWGRICLSINLLVIQTEGFVTFSYEAMLIFVLTLLYSVGRTRLDKTLNDLSGISVAIEYVCVYLLTFSLPFIDDSHPLSVPMLMILAIISTLELLIFLIITYWHLIRHFLSKTRKNTHNKA